MEALVRSSRQSRPHHFPFPPKDKPTVTVLSQSISGKAPRRFASALAFLCGFVVLGQVRAQNNGGDLVVSGIELEELRIALSASQAQLGKVEARAGELDQKNQRLSEALAVSNAEGEQFREAYRKLRERIEALGIAAIDPDPSSLQAQYIQALSDYRLTREENERLADAIGGLGAAITAYMKTVISAGQDERYTLEVALREASEVAYGAARPTGNATVVPLQDARIISLKSDFDLAVLNVGRKSGVQIGMPFRIARKDRPIGKGLVIDVRDHVCGVVVQELAAANDSVQLGDSASVDPTRQSTL